MEKDGFHPHMESNSFKGSSKANNHSAQQIAESDVQDLKNKKSTKKWGFDLTAFEPNGFQEIIKENNLHPIPQKVDSTYRSGDYSRKYRHFEWKGDGIRLITKSNPYEKGSEWQPRTNQGYASYIGIEGTPNKVDKLKESIKSHSRYIKGESPNEREFI